MAVNLSEPKGLLKVEGVELGVAEANIKYPDRNDLVILSFSEGSVTSAVFTQNVFCAAPVEVAKNHISQTSTRALVVNSGNANAVTGRQGLQSANESCEYVAEQLDILPEQVLPFSTGVIGEQLPMNKISKGIRLASKNLDAGNWLEAAKAIMTTDTVAKAVSKQVDLGRETITISGMAKGSGMICPDMATMLAYVVTDAKIDQIVLDQMIQLVVDDSFNRITVDGDTSTNDAFVITATQKADNNLITSMDSKDAKILLSALTIVAQQLSQAIIRDGEGATKFIEINVDGGRSESDCEIVAYTIAHSPLVKTALFASDPNWGRLLMAIGRSPAQGLIAEKISVKVNQLPIVTLGEIDQAYTEEKGQKVFNESELVIDVQLGDSEHCKTIWTTDLSHDYVSINADYRS